jgi:hypothetical protein
MKKTIWISTVVVAAVIGLVVLIAPATASGRVTKAKHEVTGTLRVKTLETGGGYPAPGGTYTALGLVDVELDGKAKHGVLESQGTIAQPDPSTLQAKQEDRTYFSDGSFNTTSTGIATPTPDGGFTTEFKNKVTGGAGTYKGATGNFTGTCKAPSPDPNGVIDCDLKGTISY